MHFVMKSLVLLYLLINLFGLRLTLATDSLAVDLCGVSNGMDFSAFKTLSYNWTLTNSKNESIDYYINLCSLLNTTSDNTIPVNCSNSHICKHFRNGDKSAVGFGLTRVDLKPVDNDTHKQVWAQFD
ncbi:unnamed protein product, partial [Medioppia subpectinata]